MLIAADFSRFNNMATPSSDYNRLIGSKHESYILVCLQHQQQPTTTVAACTHAIIIT